MDRSSALLVTALVGVMGFGAIWLNTPDTPPSPEELAQAQQVADARDAPDAAKMHVSVAAYRVGNAGHTGASVVCKNLIINNARYGGEGDWLTANFNWRVDEQRKLYINGQDVQVKNAFGTKEYVKYRCEANLAAGDFKPGDPRAWNASIISVAPLHQ